MKAILKSTLSKNQSNWIDLITDFTEKIGKVLLTSDDLEEIINVILVHQFSQIELIKIEINDRQGSNIIFDNSSGKSLNLSENFAFDQIGQFNCVLSISFKTGIKTDNDTVKARLKDLLFAYWKNDFRGDKTKILSESITGTKDLIANTVQMLQSEFRYISFYFSDLDKFKSINTDYNQEQGDSVILQMADLMNSFISNKPGHLIHRSGDEFIFLIYTDSIEYSLNYAFELQNIVKSHNFIVIKDSNQETISKAITIGVKIYDGRSSEDLIYESQIGFAEKAMKDDLGNKNYGTANLYEITENNDNGSELNAHTMNLAKAIIKTSNSVFPFENIWLNMISEQSYLLNKSGTELAKLQEILDWIKLDYSGSVKSTIVNIQESSYSKKVSTFDVFAAIIHGIFRHESNGEIQNNYKIKSVNNFLQLQIDNGSSVFEIPSTENVDFDFGSTPRGPLSPLAILLKIGHKPVDLPDGIFAEILIIDDRPSKGGGLPDFWEATISRLVSKVTINDNIKKVFVLGGNLHGEKTIDILRKLSEVEVVPKDFDEITYKINTSSASLHKAIEVLKGNVEHYAKETEVISSYAQFLTKGNLITTSEFKTEIPKPAPFLDKDLKLDDFALTKADGFRVQTLSQAFPLMLEIARKSGQASEIRDQAGSRLRELLDFKVELSNPLKSPLPFYYRNEADNFDQYFQKQFIDTDGLFAEHLNKQLDLVLRPVIEIISRPVESRYSTRRAILIIPNIEENGELSPLGLVSIRIIPSFESSGAVKISYSFNWRTVEALVGFPYSFYGSIKYSEYLTEKIKLALEDKQIEISLENVTYIAHSLHIFLDDYGQGIAKRISDDSSI